jgi:hypothetical protein
MKRPAVSQENLYLLLPGKVARMADMLMEDRNIGIIDAIRDIYSSPTYQKLEQEETKTWHLGPVALYQAMTQEN